MAFDAVLFIKSKFKLSHELIIDFRDVATQKIMQSYYAICSSDSVLMLMWLSVQIVRVLMPG